MILRSVERYTALTVKILALKRYAAKGSLVETLQEAKLTAGQGIEGDAHTNVSILTQTAKLWMDAQTEAGLCFGRLKENILLEGTLERGCELHFDDVMLYISTRQKYCFPSCAHKTEICPCPLATGVFFAEVLQGGMVYVGEKFAHLYFLC